MVLLGASVALATSACESGWDLEGHVITDAVADKSGSLHVYVVDDPTIDIAAVQMASPSIFYRHLDDNAADPGGGVRLSGGWIRLSRGRGRDRRLGAGRAGPAEGE